MNQPKRKVLSDFPELMLDWKQELNPEMNPNIINYSSHKRVNWCCHKCGRIWPLSVKARTIDRVGCTCDAMQRKSASLRKTLVKKKGSLRDHYPEISKLWNYEKNGEFTPDNLTPGSEYNAWWIDGEGHEWQNKVLCMTKYQGNSSQLIVGKNDLSTLRPDLAAQWNYEKNGDKSPQDYRPYSKDIVWWICYKGHEWPARINSRTQGRGCKECNKEKGTSFPEQAIFFYLRQMFPSAENRYRINRTEIDIFIPKLKVGIEYDGSYYHQSKRKQSADEAKNRYCQANGIYLIRLVAEGCMVPADTMYVIYYQDPLTEKGLDTLITKLSDYLSKLYSIPNTLDICVSRDSIPIREQYISYEKEHSIATMHPELMCEWDWEKNGRIKPEYVTEGSSVKYWWKCKTCGYSWPATPFNRAHGQGCRCCSGHDVVRGINDLATTHPELVNDWDWELNDLTPYEITAMKNYEAYWVCHKCGHHWQTLVSNRSRGRGCGRCTGKVLTPEKSLAIVNPQVAAQWDYEKNYPLTPKDVFGGSSDSAFWLCDKGHSWEAIICSRTRDQENGCPYCGNKKILAGFNDLATVRPELISEWDHGKNKIRPDEVFPKSNDKVFWKCSKGHSYPYSIASKRVGKGCPYCDGKKPVIGENDLATTHPELALEWDQEKNEGLSPHDIKAGSNKKVYWKCVKCGHSWPARIFVRVKTPSCPCCSGRKPITGFNDLATTHPEIAAYWDHEKNGEKTPQTVSHGARYKAYWKCPVCGYPWRDRVFHIIQKGIAHQCE